MIRDFSASLRRFSCTAALCLLPAAVAVADSPMFQLSPHGEKIADRYMNILLIDARNEVAFQRVYTAFKDEGKEYQLVNFIKNAIRLEPEQASLHIILGQLYAAFRDLHQAGVEFKAAARLEPQNFYARFLLANVYVKQSRMGEAMAEFKAGAALSTGMDDRVRCLHQLARVYGTVEQWDKARETWNEIAGLRSGDSRSYRLLADACRDFKQWDLAERWLNKVLELTRSDSRVTCLTLIELAEILTEQQRMEEAVAEYRKAKALVSETHWLSAEINERVRACFAARQRLADLREQLRDDLKNMPDDLHSLLELSEILVADDNLKEAAKYLQAATAASPRDVQILETYRALLVRLQDDAGFEAVSRRLIALSPQNVHYKLQDAEYHVSRGRFDRARAVWDTIIQEDPGQDARILAVARAMLLAGKLDWAESQYEQLIRVADTVDAYRIELADLYLLRSRELPPQETAKKKWVERSNAYIGKAEELLLTVSQRDTLTLAEVQWAGRLLLEQRRLQAARDILAAGRKRFPQDMGLAEMYGESCLLLGVTKTAGSGEQTKLYREAVDSHLAAYDLAPHPAIQREMNSRLMALCLGYGTHLVNGRAVQGGVGGLRPLLRKHAGDYFTRPKDPMPSWCIADIQQQAPPYVFDLLNVTNGPATVRIYVGPAHRVKSGLLYFNRAVERDALFVPGYLGKASAYSNEDSFEQAVIELRKASVIDPVNKWKYFLQIGDLYAREGQLEEALAFWDRVSERVFTDATVFFQLGTRYFRAEKMDASVKMLQQAIRINPDISFYHMTLGNVYDYLKRYNDAVSEFRRALETSSHGMLLPVRRRLAEIQLAWAYDLFDKQDYAAALKPLTEIRAFQEAMQAHYLKEEDAVALARLSPEAANVQVQIARCLTLTGDTAGAGALYSQVAKESPSAPIRLNPMRSVALGTLLQAQKAEGGLRADNLNLAGRSSARPFRLKKVRHVSLYDIAREASVTPEGLIYSGKFNWVKLEPLSGQIIGRKQAGGRAVRSRHGIELEIVTGKQGDALRIAGNEGTTDSVGLAYAWGGGVEHDVRIRLADLQITPQRIYFFADARPHSSWARIMALDPASGKLLWETAASDVRNIHAAGRFVAAIESRAHRTALRVYDADSGKQLLKKDLAPTGVWLAPVVWQDNVLLLDDIDWKLHKLNIRTGQFDFTIAFKGTFPRPPVVHEGVLYLHVRAYKERTIYLYAIAPEAGRILWRTDMQAMSVHSPPIFHDKDILYLNPETHTVFMINKATGTRHSEASYKQQMTKLQRDHIQTLRLYKDHLLLVGGRGSVDVFAIVDGE